MVLRILVEDVEARDIWTYARVGGVERQRNEGGRAEFLAPQSQQYKCANLVLRLIMTHVALVKHRRVDRGRTLTTNAAPKAIYVEKSGIHGQALDSKSVCDTRRIDLKSTYCGL